jgi:hypothetical protein
VPNPKAFPFNSERIGDLKHPRTWIGAGNRGKHRRDDSLGLRPRHKGCRIELERQTPEFLASDNAGNRFTGEATCRQRSDGRCLLGCERPLRPRGEGRVVERQSVTDDEACIELGTV